METLEVQEAVVRIVQAVRAEERSRFFFIIGSGISSPVVPTAEEMEKHFRASAPVVDAELRKVNRTPMDSYMFWFKRAYPEPWQRQKYIQNLVENTPISPANFRLAHLLLDGGIARIIVTPNFDDHLERALRLFGQNPIVCDHPDTSERIDPERNQLQIIHVHGTYQFYDCCNLKGEIARVAKGHPIGPLLRPFWSRCSRIDLPSSLVIAGGNPTS